MKKYSNQDIIPTFPKMPIYFNFYYAYLPTSNFCGSSGPGIVCSQRRFQHQIFFSGKNSEKIVIVICTLEIVIVFLEKNI